MPYEEHYPIELRELGAADAPAMLAVHRACPLQADFEVAFERDPDPLAWPRACFERFRYVGAFARGELVGFGMVAADRGWRGGAVQPWFYAGDARVLPAWRGRRLIRAVVEALDGLVWPDVHEGIGVVKQGNRPAERFAGWLRDRRDFVSEPVSELRVALLPVLVGFSGASDVRIRRALPEDADAIARCHERFNRHRPLAPVRDAGAVRQALSPQGGEVGASWIAERRGEAVGALAAWDLSPLRRARVLRYTRGAALLRALSRVASLLRARVAPLPPPGGLLRSLTVTELAVGEPGVLRALLGRVVAEAPAGTHLVQVAFVGDDPLRPAVRGIPHAWFTSDVVHVRRRGVSVPPLVRPCIDLVRV